MTVGKQLIAIGLAVIWGAVAMPTAADEKNDQQRPPTGLVSEVRLGTGDFRDVRPELRSRRGTGRLSGRLWGVCPG